MNFIVSVIRFPFGLIASIAVIGLWLVIFPFEALVVLVSFPFASLFMDRYDIKNSWLGTFPNTIKSMSKNLSDIWYWVGND